MSSLKKQSKKKHVDRGEVSEHFSSLRSGKARKVKFDDQVYHLRLFQQSVTLTAAMWNENESKGSLNDWKFGSWGIPAKHSPLFMGLVCGFLILLIVMTAMMLWKYCLLSASKKVCCRGTYSVMSRQEEQNSLPLRKEKKESLNGFENFNQIDIYSVNKPPVLQRSITMGSIAMNYSPNPDVNSESRPTKFREENFPKTSSSSSHLEPSQIEPLMSRDLHATHLYLQKLYLNLDLPKSLSMSTSTLEDIYAKVNFSKKRKNRMRKGDAAIIAMSKSHSGNIKNSLELNCSALVVYNERTAL